MISEHDSLQRNQTRNDSDKKSYFIVHCFTMDNGFHESRLSLYHDYNLTNMIQHDVATLVKSVLEKTLHVHAVKTVCDVHSRRVQLQHALARFPTSGH